MLKLLVKDFKALGLFWLLGLAFNIFFVMVFVEINLAFLFVQVILTFLLAMVQPFVEDRFGLASFLNSLPVARGDLVKAKYTCTGLLALAGLAVYAAVPSALCRLVRFPHINPAPLLSPAGLLSFVLLLALLEIVFLPLYFRYGLGKSIWLFVAVLAVLGAILPGALRLLAGLAGRRVAEIFPLDREILAVPYKPFLPLARSLQAALGTVGLAIIGLLFLAGLVWFSLYLSIRFYKKREF